MAHHKAGVKQELGSCQRDALCRGVGRAKAVAEACNRFEQTSRGRILRILHKSGILKIPNVIYGNPHPPPQKKKHKKQKRKTGQKGKSKTRVKF